MNNIAYLLALHSVAGLGPIRLKALLDYFKDPKLGWEADVKELKQIGIPKNAVEALSKLRKTLDPEKYLQDIQKSGIKWIGLFDENYPKLLGEIYDPPVVLYYKGDASFWNNKAIGVVGTRKITGYGKMVTEQFTKGLVLANLTIVSGLARGVDSQAHWTTVLQGGKTIAVLGGGLNQIYPPENRNLAEEIVKSGGAVISEFSPDEPSMPGNFPSRNRIISGLSLGVLVTEAATDSGSLITAREALEQGREVFAIPGPITSDLSKGPIDLIKQGAKPVTSVEEILDELGINKVASTKPPVLSKDLTEQESKILELLQNEQMHVDEICRKLNLPSSSVSATLLKMEISGLVQSLGSGSYSKA